MEVTVHVPTGHDQIDVIGSGERNLKMIREALGVGIAARGGTVRLSGEKQQINVARRVIEHLSARAREHKPMTREQVLGLITEESSRAQREGAAYGRRSHRAWDGRLRVYANGNPVEPRTENQRVYIEAIRDHDLVFGIGPAGTGKTYLAVASAVHLLREGMISKVILCRPAVEAGEKLGFLPGDLEAKVNPYLRPLLDALHDMMDYEDIRRFMASDIMEVVPLAFMRGRTLNGAVVILDEAQNTTRGQMKMFLTRMGHGSKMIVTGDTTQIDLPDPTQSGLIDAARRLRRVAGVSFVQLTGSDVVRHRLVQRVIEAYGDESGRSVHGEAIERALAGGDTPERVPAEHPEPGETPKIDG